MTLLRFYALWNLCAIFWGAFSIVILMRKNSRATFEEKVEQFAKNWFLFPWHLIKEMRQKSIDE